MTEHGIANMTIVGPPECRICHDRAEEIAADGKAYCGSCYRHIAMNAVWQPTERAAAIEGRRAPEPIELVGLDKALSLVRQFHYAFGCPVRVSPKVLSNERIIKRVAWMHEKITEFVLAADIGEQADAMIDLIYFTLGTLAEMGIDNPQELLEVVHGANMAKLGADGRPIYIDGKVSKPDGWQAPRIGDYIR